MNKSIREGRATIKLLRDKHDALKALVEDTVVGAIAQFEEVKRLKYSLKRAQSTLDSLEERVSQLKDEVVVTFIHHFEKARRQVVFLYPNLDLSLMDLFEVIQDGQLVDEE